MHLTVEANCLMWGMCVVMPAMFRSHILKELHHEHSGMTIVWWPGMDADIEDHVKVCWPCQSVKEAPPVAPLHPWIWPGKSWQCRPVDYAGPFNGHMLLIVVDAHSKWPQCFEVSSSTAELLKQNCLYHVLTAPYHPASNRAAERFEQTFKQVLKATAGSLIPHYQRQMGSFLLKYRVTPHATTGKTPSQLLIGKQVRTRLDSLRPDLEQRVTNKQPTQKQQHDTEA